MNTNTPKTMLTVHHSYLFQQIHTKNAAKIHVKLIRISSGSIVLCLTHLPNL